MSASTDLQQRFAAAMMGNYGVPPLALDHGAGSHVWDADGQRYLDLIAGIAVSALGHAHPAIVRAVTAQVQGRAHEQPVRARAGGAARREAAVPAARRRPRLLLQLGHRGQRGALKVAAASRARAGR